VVAARVWVAASPKGQRQPCRGVGGGGQSRLDGGQRGAAAPKLVKAKEKKLGSDYHVSGDGFE
jgi:hypothetical protein